MRPGSDPAFARGGRAHLLGENQRRAGAPVLAAGASPRALADDARVIAADRTAAEPATLPSSFRSITPTTVGAMPTVALTDDRESGFDSGEAA